MGVSLVWLQTLVVNVLMAPVILKERLTRVDVIATAVIVSGTVLSVAFGSKESTDHDISERTCRCTVIIVAVVVAVVVVAAVVAVTAAASKGRWGWCGPPATTENPLPAVCRWR